LTNATKLCQAHFEHSFFVKRTHSA
jgi:hypothetical protein